MQSNNGLEESRKRTRSICLELEKLDGNTSVQPDGKLTYRGRCVGEEPGSPVVSPVVSQSRSPSPVSDEEISAKRVRRSESSSVLLEEGEARDIDGSPFQRVSDTGLYPFPSMDVLSRKFTYITASMQFLVSALSDSDLDTLTQKASPLMHSGLWEEVRDAFCECQIALRQRGDRNVLPGQMLARLVYALYCYGRVTGHSGLQLLFPFEDEVADDPIQFLRDNQQQFKLCSPAVFMGCLADILTDDPKEEWGGFAQQKSADISQVGMVRGYGISTKTLKDENSVGIAVPLDDPPQGAGTSLESLLRVVSCQRVSDQPVSQSAARHCYEKEQIKQQMKQQATESAVRRIIIDDIEKQLDGIDQWDEELPRPHYVGKEWHIGAHSDSVLMSMPIFLEEKDKPQVKWESLETLLSDTGSGEEIADVPEYLRTFQCQRTKREGIPDVVVHDKTTGKNYIHVAVSPQHGAAFLIAQELYRIAGFKTMGVTRVDRGDGKCHLLISLPMEDKSGKKGGRAFCYEHGKVMASMRDGAYYGAAVVFDALLKNDDIANSRMAIVSQPTVKGVMKPYVYRTEFHCLGFSRSTKRQKAVMHGVPLEGSVVDDLNTLLKKECFKNARKSGQVQLGLERLATLRDETFHQVVAHYWPGSQGDAQVVAEQILARKNTLLTMKGVVLSRERQQKPLAPVFHNKRHVSAVRALCESHGEVALPNIFAGDELLETKGRLRTLLCHVGDAREYGSYITLHRIGSVWFVVDDIGSDGEGGISLDEFVSKEGLGHLKDEDNPAGMVTLENMLKCGFLRTTPELMLWELEAAEKRREWQPDFEREVIQSWQVACGHSPDSGSDQESSDDGFMECVSHFSPPQSHCERDAALEPELSTLPPLVSLPPKPQPGPYSIPIGARTIPVTDLFVEVVRGGKRVKVPPAELT